MPTQRNAATRLVGPPERGGEASPACIGTSKSCHTNTPEHARNAATRLVRPPECGRAELRQCARKTEKTTKKTAAPPTYTNNDTLSYVAVLSPRPPRADVFSLSLSQKYGAYCNALHHSSVRATPHHARGPGRTATRRNTTTHISPMQNYGVHDIGVGHDGVVVVRLNRPPRSSYTSRFVHVHAIASAAIRPSPAGMRGQQCTRPAMAMDEAFK